MDRTTDGVECNAGIGDDPEKLSLVSLHVSSNMKSA